MRITYVLVMNALLIPMAARAEPEVRPEEAVSSDEALICKRFLETGSLVKKRRVCLSQDQWAEITANARKMTADLQDPTCSLRSSVGGCVPDIPE